MSQKNATTGTTAGTLAAGDDARILQVATNTTNIATNTINISTNTTSIAKLTLAPTATKTSAYTAAAQDLVLADASGGAFTVTLPTGPADGTLVAVKKTDSSTGVVTVLPGTGATFATGGASILLSLAGHSVTWRYQSSGTKWVGIANDLPLSAADTRYMQQSATSAPVYVYNTYASAPALPANSVVISITGA